MHWTYKALGVVVLLYIAALAAVAYLYQKTQCPAGGLSECKLMFNKSKANGGCGSIRLSGPAGCEEFMEVEECVCSRCSTCMEDVHRAHCAKSREQRLEECRRATSQ